MKKTVAALAFGFSLFLGANAANAETIYNGLSTPSQKPDQQGWTYLSTTYSPAPSATATSSGTILNSGNSVNYAGYFKQSPVTFNGSTGYTVTFNVKINSESSSSSNRAGFSIIVTSDRLIGETQPYSLELGFWKNSIWAQNVGFTRGENVSFNTQSAAVQYKLYVKGDRYQLFANGSTTPILTGTMRKYSYTPPPGFSNPYTTPNLIFLGDNTTSATGNVTIATVDVKSGQ